MDNERGVVLDVGSGMVKAGFAGNREFSLRCAFPNIVKVPRNPGIMVGMDVKDCFIGDEYQTKGRDNCDPKMPLPIDGRNPDFHYLEKILHHTFYNELRAPPEEYTVLMSSLPIMNKYTSSKLISMLFETFNVRGLKICDAELLSLVATGRTSGVGLDLGHGAPSVCSIIDGVPIQHSKIRLENVHERKKTKSGLRNSIGGFAITETLCDIILQKNEPLFHPVTRAGKEIVRDIKESLCYVTLDLEEIKEIHSLGTIENNYSKILRDDYIHEEKDPEILEHMSYELPDGAHIRMFYSEYIIPPEILFKPSLAGYNNLPGVHELVRGSIESSDKSYHSMLYNNIVTFGGTSLFRNFGARLKMELENNPLIPNHNIIRVVETEDRKYLPSIGGSVYWSTLTSSSSSSRRNNQIAKMDDYHEHGSQRIWRMFFSSSCTVSDEGDRQDETLLKLFSESRDGRVDEMDRKERIMFVKEYIVSVEGDNEGTRSACKGSRNWYYFRVKGCSENDQLKISIRNTKSLKLYRQGFKPVCKVGDNGKWVNVKNFRTFRDDNKKYVQCITYKVTKNGANTPIYFAYSYPFSYEDLERKIEKLERQYKDHPNIYFHSETIIESLQGRNLYGITISSKSGMSEKKSENMSLPCHKDQEISNRPNTFKKKPYYLLTSRIHPGETPASFICNGFIDYILGSTPGAEQLRELFVFKIIPMLNPDGVSCGSWRYHSLGFELNGCFWDPDPTEEPVIFGVKEMMKYLYVKEDLEFYMDLHSHVNMKNAFIFGNALQDYEEQIQTNLYPRLVSSICPHVDFLRCNFSYKRMENFTGTGRVAFYTQSRMIHCYTLEINFHSGDRGKVVSSYTKKHFREVGKGLALALLYFRGVGGQKRKQVRARERAYLERQMRNKVKLWRGSNKLKVRYAYQGQLDKLMEEFRGKDVSKKRICQVLCEFGGLINYAREILEKEVEEDEDEGEVV